MGASRLVVVASAILVLALLLVSLASACGGDVPEGTQFGFVHEVSGGTLVFDPAEWLSGKVADAAYRAHGEEPAEPFYIENPKVEKLRLPVDPAARFSLLAYDSTGTPALEESLSYDQLARLWATGDDDQLMSAEFGSYEFGLPMHLTITAGRVAGGKEQYVP